MFSLPVTRFFRVRGLVSQRGPNFAGARAKISLNYKLWSPERHFKLFPSGNKQVKQESPSRQRRLSLNVRRGRAPGDLLGASQSVLPSKCEGKWISELPWPEEGTGMKDSDLWLTFAGKPLRLAEVLMVREI